MADESTVTPVNETMEFLKSARDIAFLFAVFLYFMGWIYIYYFLDKFGLSVKAMDVDIYNLLIYSCNVFIYLYHQQKTVIALALLILGLIALSKKYTRLFAPFYPLLVILLFPTIFYYARAAAEDSAQLILDHPTNLRTITFVFKELKSEPVVKKGVKKNKLVIYNEEERLNVINQSKSEWFRLLVSNKDEYYLLQYSTNYQRDRPIIYVVKKEMIEYATITK